ncbi:serine hydrolase-domain-containing protein [Microdochium bolleyi]|uniref:Serine hydrolase-domain-containing protein n=1 Tax=Microdochium bolleyi TaxID=196109 RepID=A0A136J982_9PEZI|nr:serine hydrolase-domain-containing protein [Microdochium bolleyi]
MRAVFRAPAPSLGLISCLGLSIRLRCSGLPRHNSNWHYTAAMSTTTSGAATPRSTTSSKAGGGEPKKKMRILMLHGYTQSGPLFDSKTKALTKLIAKTLSAPKAAGGLGVEPVFIHPTGPHRLRPRDIPGFVPAEGTDPDDDDSSDAWAWFRKNEVDGTYRGFEAGMRTIADAIRESSSAPGDEGTDEARIDGVIGFSQGGATAALVASALETSPAVGRPMPDPATTPSPSAETPAGEPGDWSWVDSLREANNSHPLKFAVIYSGFYTPVPGLQWLLQDPPIQTPTAHFIGSLDTVVDESRSQALVERCNNPKVFVHPGGHYVPVAKQWAMALVGYIKEAYSQAAEKEQGAQENGGKEPSPRI